MHFCMQLHGFQYSLWENICKWVCCNAPPQSIHDLIVYFVVCCLQKIQNHRAMKKRREQGRRGGSRYFCKFIKGTIMIPYRIKLSLSVTEL